MVAAPAVSAAPDLVASNIYPQYVFADLTNVFSVNVTNQGDTNTTVNCTVSLTITGMSAPLTGTVTAPLSAGSSRVVDVGSWKPTPLENLTMTAFADCDGEVGEGTNESNNNLTVSRNTTGNCAVDDMLPDTCYGYRGDNPLSTVYEGTGKVLYSVGDFKYKNNTVNFDIGASGDENQVDGLTADIPAGATMKSATLYVYYCYRKPVSGPNPGADPRPDYEMSINGGSTLTTSEYYTFIKGFTTSEYQYGTLVYDVTSTVTGDGAYQAVRSNCSDTAKGYVSGMALMIIYDDCSDDTYRIAHGYDRLATYYKTQYKVVPEDATTTATLTDVDPALIASANLLTVTVDAVAPGSESQQFNSCPWDVGAWNCIAGVSPCGWNYPLGINRGDVTSCITASGSDEVVQFQERTSNGFAATNAILTVEKERPNSVYFMPDDIRLPKQGDTTNVSIWIDTSEALGTGRVNFSYTCCCANVTAYYPNTTNWNAQNAANIGTCGLVTIGFGNSYVAGIGPGLVHIGDFTIECCGSSYCETDMDFNACDSYLENTSGDQIPVDWNDGTFKCNIPDLKVTMVKGTEILPIGSGNYMVNCTVTNVGDVDASASHVNLTVDGPPSITPQPVGILAPGASEVITFGPITLTEGYDDLKACADCYDEVVETDETNNCMTGRYPGEVVISIQPAVTYVQPQDRFDVKVYVDTKGMDVYAVQYSLTYNTSVVRAETQNKDTFLGPLSETMIIVNEIDQPHGEAFYAETRKFSGAVNESDNVTNVHFIAIGVRGDITALTLDDIIISNEDGVAMAYTIEDGTVEITTNTPPVANGTSKHRTNNVAQKYQCISTLCSCSYDLDYPGKGGNISYIRWAFGDGQYGTSEGLPVDNCTCKEHKYESWLWNTSIDDYDPFNVVLTVTDDGCPEITNTTEFDVTVYIAGDANGDGEVNVLDAVWVGKYWRDECGCGDCLCEPCYGYLWANEQTDGADLNNDCEINVLDAVIIGANWRHVAW